MDKIHQFLQIGSWLNYAGHADYEPLNELRSNFNEILKESVVIDITESTRWFYRELKNQRIAPSWYEKLLTMPAIPKDLSNSIFYESTRVNSDFSLRSGVLVRFFAYKAIMPPNLTPEAWFDIYNEAVPFTDSLQLLVANPHASPYNNGIGIVKMEYIQLDDQNRITVSYSLTGCLDKNRCLINDDSLRLIADFEDVNDDDKVRLDANLAWLKFSPFLISNQMLEDKVEFFLNTGSWKPREWNFLTSNGFSFPKQYYDFSSAPKTSEPLVKRKFGTSESSFQPHPIRFPKMRPAFAKSLLGIHKYEKLTASEFTKMSIYARGSAEHKYPNDIYNHSYFDDEDEIFANAMYFLFKAAGKNIFSFEPKLAENFQRSDISAIHLADLKFPYQAFHLSFGQIKEIKFTYLGQDFYLDGAYISHHHKYPLQILLTASNKNTLNAGDQEWIVNPVFFFSFPKTPGNSWNEPIGDIIENLVEHQFSWETPDKKKYRSVYLHHFSQSTDLMYNDEKYVRKALYEKLPFLQDALRFIINGLCFITAYPEYIEKTYLSNAPAKLVEQALSDKENNRKRKAEHELNNKGFSKILFCRLIAAGETESEKATGNGTREVVRHWRRGHWRRQVHGANLAERKLMWIMPTVVRRDKPEEDIKGKIYSIKTGDNKLELPAEKA